MPLREDQEIRFDDKDKSECQHQKAAYEFEFFRMFFLKSVLAHRDDENEDDYRERHDVINVVKRHVEIFFECRNVLDRKDSRIDSGKSDRAAELDQIDEKRKSYSS